MVRITDFRSVYSGSNPGPMTSPTLLIQVVKDSIRTALTLELLLEEKGPNSPCIQTAKMFRPT